IGVTPHVMLLGSHLLLLGALHLAVAVPCGGRRSRSQQHSFNHARQSLRSQPQSHSPARQQGWGSPHQFANSVGARHCIPSQVPRMGGACHLRLCRLLT
ncbi:hypothetical protein KI387_030494, partial [Taxus chinensis]